MTFTWNFTVLIFTIDSIHYIFRRHYCSKKNHPWQMRQQIHPEIMGIQIK